MKQNKMKTTTTTDEHKMEKKTCSKNFEEALHRLKDRTDKNIYRINH